MVWYVRPWVHCISIILTNISAILMYPKCTFNIVSEINTCTFLFLLIWFTLCVLQSSNFVLKLMLKKFNVCRLQWHSFKLKSHWYQVCSVIPNQLIPIKITTLNLNLLQTGHLVWSLEGLVNCMCSCYLKSMVLNYVSSLTKFTYLLCTVFVLTSSFTQVCLQVVSLTL